MVINKHNDTNPRTTTLLGERGFTLIEMLVVVAVIVIVTSVMLANNSRFGGTVLLQNLAYDIALTTRESQVYSTSVVRSTTGFTTSFGVHYEIDPNDPDSSMNKNFRVFSDANDNELFDTGEWFEQTEITRGFYIGDICVTPQNTTQETCSVEELHITFKHPEPDAIIRSNVDANATYRQARIKVVSPRDDELCIYTHMTGWTSVRNCP